MIPGSKNGHPSFRKSFAFALQGLRTAVATERNIKVMLAAALIAIFCGALVRLDPVSWAIIIACCGMVIGMELMNTAIETTLDLVSPEYHPLVGRAKDIAAAAVWVVSIASAIIGIIVFVSAICLR